VLTPIVILESSFGGPVIYENKEFVSPNQVRADLRLSKAGRYNRRNRRALRGRRRRVIWGSGVKVDEEEREMSWMRAYCLLEQFLSRRI
jgi:ribosome biogenesis protein BRX1